MREIRTIKGYFSIIRSLARNPVLSLKGFDNLDEETKECIADTDGYICELETRLRELNEDKNDNKY